MGASILRFSLIFIATAIGVPLALLVIQNVFQINLFSSFVPFVPYLAGAMFEGQKYVQQFGDMPTGKEMWLAAIVMGIVGILITLLATAVIFLAVPEASEAVADIPFSILAIGFGVMIVPAILMCRIFVWSGARGAHKKLQRSGR